MNRYEFRANKTRSVAIIKRKSVNTGPLNFSKPSSLATLSNSFPSIHSNSMKTLGRVSDRYRQKVKQKAKETTTNCPQCYQ